MLEEKGTRENGVLSGCPGPKPKKIEILGGSTELTAGRSPVLKALSKALQSVLLECSRVPSQSDRVHPKLRGPAPRLFSYPPGAPFLANLCHEFEYGPPSC